MEYDMKDAALSGDLQATHESTLCYIYTMMLTDDPVKEKVVCAYDTRTDAFFICVLSDTGPTGWKYDASRNSAMSVGL
jgi:hypothetical protein